MAAGRRVVVTVPDWRVAVVEEPVLRRTCDEVVVDAEERRCCDDTAERVCEEFWLRCVAERCCDAERVCDDDVDEERVAEDERRWEVAVVVVLPDEFEFSPAVRRVCADKSDGNASIARAIAEANAELIKFLIFILFKKKRVL